MAIENDSAPDAGGEEEVLGHSQGGFLRTWGPWLGAIAVLVYLFWEVPLEGTFPFAKEPFLIGFQAGNSSALT